MDDNSQPTDGGLLDDVSVDTDAAAPTKAEVSHLAAPADETAAPKERPDYLPENFWNADKGEADLEAMAKSWSDLRKTVSQGKHKPPADGNYDVSAFGDTPEDDPVRQHVVNWAKEYGISQAAFDKLVGDVVAMGGEQAKQVAISREAERKALGPNAESIIRGMTDWGRGLVSKGIWGKDDFEEFKVWGGTASGMKALMKLRETYEGTRIPVESVPVDGAPSKDDLYAMVRDPKYQTDPAFRAKVEKMFYQVVK